MYSAGDQEPRFMRAFFFLPALILFIAFSLVPGSLHAQTPDLTGKALNDEELAGVTGQAGVSINFDITQNISIDTAAWGDRDGHAGANGAGWIGYKNLTVSTLHIWPRTDFTMINANWANLEYLTLDVATVPSSVMGSPFGTNVTETTGLVIGIPTFTQTMESFTADLMLGPDSVSSPFAVGGQIDGTYAGWKDIPAANLNQLLAKIDVRGYNLYTGPGGRIFMNAHGSGSTAGAISSSTLYGSGVSIGMTGTKFHLDVDSIAISDTDNGNWIELRNFHVDDGVGSYFSFDTGSTPITIDVGSDPTTGLTAVHLVLSDNITPRTYLAENLIFCNQDIGRLQIADVTNLAELYFGAHQDGTTGINFEYRTMFHIAQIKYRYQNPPQPKEFWIQDITLAAQATGAPETPILWAFSGMYQVGDLRGVDIDVDNDPGNATVPNPATIDVGTDTDTGETSMLLNLPMKGSVRIKDVSIGPNDFGPCAIDGITVHHLKLTFHGM
jgi:hypothetical protein